MTDGNGIQGTLTMGVSTEDGRGNITAYASYQDNKQILQRDRDYSACTLAREPDDVVRLRRLRHVLPGPVHGLRRELHAGSGPDACRHGR